MVRAAAVLLVLVATEEKVEGSRLEFDDGMEIAEGDNGDGLCVCPSPFAPEFHCEDDSLHGVFAIGRGGFEFSLIASMLHFTMANSMACTARLSLWFLVRRFCRADFRKNSFPDNDSEGRRGGTGQQGKD